MSGVAIRAEGLSKQYQIGGQKSGYRTIRETIAHAFSRSASTSPSRESDTFWALKDISFEVPQGEVLGIIGRNGAGKSTLLKILSRITEPTAGIADLCGRVGSLLEVGTGFHPELTGRENVFLNGAIIGMKRADITRRFDAIVAFADVDRFIDTPVKHYSSGMYLRLAFAVAAHLEPEILLVDEVLAVGDAAFQKKCLGKMGAVAKEGRTVLFVSHNLGAVANLCDRTLLLAEGAVRMIGENGAVIERYLAEGAGGASSAIDLSARADRAGSGRLHFASVAIRDGSGRVTGDVRAGEAAAFDVTYRMPTCSNQRLSALFEIKIHDQSGFLLVTLSSYLLGQDLEVAERDGVASCRVPNLLLAPGTYSGTLVSYINGTLADEVDNAFQFMVIESDFYDSGKLPKRRVHGSFLMPHAWAAPEAVPEPVPASSTA